MPLPTIFLIFSSDTVANRPTLIEVADDDNLKAFAVCVQYKHGFLYKDAGFDDLQNFFISRFGERRVKRLLPYDK